MKLTEYLKHIKEEKSFGTNQVTCFIGIDYPYLFFTKLFSFLNEKELISAGYRILNFESTDLKELQENLVQTFLGQLSFYWLSKINIKSTDKKSVNFLKFLLEYKGPHFVSFYLDKAKASKFLNSFNKNVIDLDQNFGLSEIKQVFDFFNFRLNKGKLELIKNIFTDGFNNLNLDQICVLMQYLDLINTKKTNDFVTYLSKIVNKTPPSFNLLTKYFFENKPREFFDVWSKVCRNYPDMFWISFWAEKIYRAYFIVKFLKDKQDSKIRLLSFGLPYMFIKRDWKNFSLNKLSKYHNFLYTNNFKVKMGSKFCFLDLFYLNHFNQYEY